MCQCSRSIRGEGGLTTFTLSLSRSNHYNNNYHNDDNYDNNPQGVAIPAQGIPPLPTISFETLSIL